MARYEMRTRCPSEEKRQLETPRIGWEKGKGLSLALALSLSSSEHGDVSPISDGRSKSCDAIRCYVPRQTENSERCWNKKSVK